MKLWITCSTIIFSSLTLSACKEDLEYKISFEQGAIKGIVIPSEMKVDKPYYEKVVAAECRKGTLCILHFFYDIDRVSLPFSDEAMAKHSAVYNRNPHTGLDRLMLNCALGDFDPNKCFINE